MQAKVNGKTYDIELVSKEGNIVTLKLNGELIQVDAVMSESGFCSIIHDGQSYNAESVSRGEGKYIITNNFKRFEVELSKPRKKYLRGNDVRDLDDEQTSITAPMPGKIVKIHVAPGQAVKFGDPLLVIEAMKMQSTYTASQDAIVETVAVNEGDAVVNDQLLISFKRNHED